VPNLPLRKRVWIACGILLAGTVALHSLSHGEAVPVKQPLAGLPLTFEGWHGVDEALEPQILQAAGVNDYLSRVYVNDLGQALAVYVGFYATQRTGDTIHSPKNCLPGSGWQPVRAGRLAIPRAGKPPLVVNEYLIEKGLQRDLVIYWYQARGRIIVSEYAGKMWQVVDAITRNRTDGALVRLVTSTGEGEEKARARLIGFTQTLEPQLNRFIPD